MIQKATQKKPSEILPFFLGCHRKPLLSGWIELPKKMNASNLFPKAIENKVAYVAGSVFHCNGKGRIL
jgi:hypothetical protein